MATNVDRHRRSIRLRGYDYAQDGAYFLTLLTQQRECLFGEIVDGELVHSSLGRIVIEELERSSQIRHELELGTYVVMPNHVHLVVAIRNDNLAPTVGAHGRAPLRRRPRSLGSFIAGFKAAATKRINQLRDTPGFPVWQRNYYERIVRNEDALNRIRQYIIDNPANWAEDAENSLAQRPT